MNTLKHFETVDAVLAYASDELTKTLEQDLLLMETAEAEHYTDEDRADMENRIDDLKSLETVIANAGKSHAFIQQIARFTKDGEETGAGEEFDLSNDDAVSTLHDIIDTARAMV